ncbi:hypothetical protein ACW9IK_19770 [Pseudomonas gingeri]
MKRKFSKRLILLPALLISQTLIAAPIYKWELGVYVYPGVLSQFKKGVFAPPFNGGAAADGSIVGSRNTPQEVCETFWSHSLSSQQDWVYASGSASVAQVDERNYECIGGRWIAVSEIAVDIDWSFARSPIAAKIIGCTDPDEKFSAGDMTGGACLGPEEISDDENQGDPDDKDSCAPSGLSGNPINNKTGNKFYSETIYSDQTQLDASIYYNSDSTFWSMKYGMRVKYADSSASVILPDGKIYTFKNNNNTYSSSSPKSGSLVYNQPFWKYTTAKGDVYEFKNASAIAQEAGIQGAVDPIALLSSIKEVGKDKLTVTVNLATGYLHITDSNQNSIDVMLIGVALTPYQLIMPGQTITFDYDNNSNITAMNKVWNGGSSKKIFLYEDANNPRALTGVTDESGIRIATWSYDQQGRAISSSHAAGADLVTLEYGDQTTTVTNSLGRKSIYHYNVKNNAPKIVSIEGSPTPNCPHSNSTFEYNSAGDMSQSTDALNTVTKYEYNSRGLETKRIEGYNTASERITETEWHPDYALKTLIKTPLKIESMTYDPDGRLISTTSQNR